MASTHLKNIKLYGFKSIKNLDIEMNPINILIGANGVGKSNLISLFPLLRSMSQGRFLNYVKSKGGGANLMHFGPKLTKKIKIEVEVDINKYCVDLSHQPSEDLLYISEEFCGIASNEFRQKYFLKGRNGESGLHEGDADSKHVRSYTLEYLNQCRLYHFHDTSDTAGFKLYSDINDNSALKSNAENIASFLFYLKKEYQDSYDEIVENIRTVAPFFSDFYLQPQKMGDEEKIILRWLHKDSNEAFSATQLSDGTARFICLAVLFLQPENLRPQTIILDEPELGLHPAALEILADIIKSFSRKGQLICSTQSVTFSNSFDAKSFITVEMKEGISYFKRVNEKELEEWLKDYQMGEIWEKNLIGGRPEW